MLTVEASPDGTTLTFKPVGRFDGKIYQEFQDAYQRSAEPTSHYMVDFARIDYIDSSGLGMLLKLRERAGGSKTRVHLANCSSEIKKILRIANFHSLFTVA